MTSLEPEKRGFMGGRWSDNFQRGPATWTCCIALRTAVIKIKPCIFKRGGVVYDQRWPEFRIYGKRSNIVQMQSRRCCGGMRRGLRPMGIC